MQESLARAQARVRAGRRAHIHHREQFFLQEAARTARARTDVRAGGAQAEHIPRSQLDARRYRDGRRSLPRAQQRDQGAGRDSHLRLRGQDDLRHQVRLCGAQPRVRLPADHAESGCRRYDTRNRRDDSRLQPRAAAVGHNGRHAGQDEHQHSVLHRRRRIAPLRRRRRRRGEEAGAQDIRSGYSQDDRQRPHVRGPQLRLRDVGRRSGERDTVRPCGGEGHAWRNRAREAHGARFGLHSGICLDVQPGREFLPCA